MGDCPGSLGWARCDFKGPYLRLRGRFDAEEHRCYVAGLGDGKLSREPMNSRNAAQDAVKGQETGPPLSLWRERGPARTSSLNQ